MIYSALVFQQGTGTPNSSAPFLPDPESFWFKLEGDSQNLVSGWGHSYS